MANKLSKIIADFSTSLAVKAAVGATSGTLQSATDDDGVALPAGQYGLTLDGNSSNKEYWLCDLNGTALTNIQNISRQGVLTSGSVREHRIGASVKITNFADLLYINNLLDGTDTNENTPKFSNTTHSGDISFTGTSTVGLKVKSLTTAQRVALTPTTTAIVYDTTIGEYYVWQGGAWLAVASGSVQPNASTTVAGKIELATAAERAAGTATGGTGATLVPTNDALVKTSSGAADENKLGILDSTGKYAIGFLPATATPTASKIVISDSTSKINDGWLGLTTAGDIVYSDGTDLQRLAAGTSNQILKSGTTPAWGNLDYFVGRSAETTTGTITTSQDVSHTIACGFVPRYFEAIISGDMCQNVVWSSGAANGLGTQTLIIKGIIGGAVDWVQTTLTEASTAPNGRPQRNPYFDTTGSTTLCTFGTGTSDTPGSGTITTSGSHTFKLKSITASSNNIVFTWAHVNNGAQIVDLRTRVEYLHVTP